MKSAASCGVNYLPDFSFFVETLPFVAKFVQFKSYDTVKSAASCGEVFLQVFSSIMKVLPFMAKFVLFES